MKPFLLQHISKTAGDQLFFVAQIDELYQLKKEEKKPERKRKKKRIYRYDFTPNGVDLNSFPYNVWRKLSKDILLDDRTEYFINPTGKFVVGGPHGDSGLTGRKVIVDAYGGMGRHGGGAFSGKDPSKVDRSAAYMCRWVAKHIVAAGLADKCELQVAYAIGYPTPVSIRVDTFGTGKVEEKAIESALEGIFSFKPADMVDQLDLLRPIYRKTTHYGHFTNPELPWEQLDETRLASLKQLLH